MTRLSIIFAVTLLFTSTALCGQSINSIRVLKISGEDERAVIKDIDGKKKIIKPGDSIGRNGKVVEIAAGRVVIEEKKGDETEKVIIRLEAGKQTIERLRKTAGENPRVLAPAEPKKAQAESQGKKRSSFE